jgi:hypothetical protein
MRERDGDWTRCSVKERVYCHFVANRATHIVNPRRTACYETASACRRARALSDAMKMEASSCFALGPEGRTWLRPD